MSIKGGSEMHKKEKEMIAPKALVHSRTVVEKQDYVTTGISTYVEGDLLGIDLNEYKRFDLGDSVQLTFYSPVGIHRLQSTIIGKDEGSIAVIFPPRAFQFVEKRESPRLEVTAEGSLRIEQKQEQKSSSGLSKAEPGEATDSALDDQLLAHLEALLSDGEVPEERDSSSDVPIRIQNISMSGLGFLIEHPTMRLFAGDNVKADLQIEGQRKLSCSLHVVRAVDESEGRYYGAKIEGMDEVQQRTLRAFILREQVSIFYRNRSNQLKRANKSRSDN